MLDRNAVASTHALIEPWIRRTPVLAVDPTDIGITAGALHLKLELMQRAGSFKTRGAFANLLLRDVPAAGVVAASGGNHGAAVAYAAQRRGVPAKIFVPSVASAEKVARIRRYGADLVVGGAGYSDALAASEEWRTQSHALPIHAFDQRETVLGQGTLGRELEDQVPEIDTLLVGVGGGGLCAGLCVWYGRRVRIVGVEPERSPTLTHALRAGAPVDAPVGGIAADSLAPRRIGDFVFPLLKGCVERTLLIPDAAIVAAQRALWEHARVVAEPGGATAFAALHSGAYVPQPDERVAVIVSGGNTTAVQFADAA